MAIQDIAISEKFLVHVREIKGYLLKNLIAEFKKFYSALNIENLNKTENFNSPWMNADGRGAFGFSCICRGRGF